jgi:3-deoxy-D-manno-octulosonic-acid transferase
VWDWSIWGALVVGGVAILVATAHVVARSLQAWRSLKRVRRHLVRDLDALAAAAERTAERAAQVSDATRVERSLRRLGRSLAQLAVLRAAMDDVSDAAPRILWGLVRR